MGLVKMIHPERLDRQISLRKIVSECYEEAEKERQKEFKNDEFRKSHTSLYHAWTILAHYFEATANDLTDNFEKFTFLKPLVDAERKYQKKVPLYGESWKAMTLRGLRKRLAEELDELQKAKNNKEEYSELLDVINIACMLAERLRVSRND